MTIYDQQLDKNPANFVALSPVSFVERSAEVFGDLPAVVHGQRRYTWAQTRERTARLAAALKAHGISRGQTVSTMLANTPEMVEAHYAVPALGAVLNTLNIRRTDRHFNRMRSSIAPWETPLNQRRNSRCVGSKAVPGRSTAKLRGLQNGLALRRV